MLGTLIAGVYVVLLPSLGTGALWLAWALFWIGFAGCEAVLRGEIGPASAVVQGVGAAVLSGVMCYAISGMWPEPTPSDPHIIRSLVLWTGTFVSGFVPLFWRTGVGGSGFKGSKGSQGSRVLMGSEVLGHRRSVGGTSEPLEPRTLEPLEP